MASRRVGLFGRVVAVEAIRPGEHIIVVPDMVNGTTLLHKSDVRESNGPRAVESGVGRLRGRSGDGRRRPPESCATSKYCRSDP